MPFSPTSSRLFAPSPAFASLTIFPPSSRLPAPSPTISNPRAFSCLLAPSRRYELEGLEHGSWVGRRHRIVARYVRSPWFFVDIVSVFPWWVFSLQSSSAAAAATAEAVATSAAAPGGEPLSAVRLVKLLRMLKLARMLKAAEYFAPIVKDVIMVRLEFTYAALKVLELFMWLFLFTHLQASAPPLTLA